MDEALKIKSLKTIGEIFHELFLDEQLVITEDTSPADIEEWDSLAHVNILTAVERSFDIRFTAEDMGSIDNVSTLLSILAERSGK